MTTSFPTGLDALTNPTGSSSLTSPDHAGQHADANDAIEALQTKVGVNGSAVTSSLDYMVAASKVVTDKIDPASASSNQVLKYNGTKFVPATGASVTVSDTPPTSPTPQAGDQWYESDTGRQLIYYDGFWVEIGSTATTNVNANDLSGTTLASNVVSSSLTSVGTLGSLAVTNDITRGGVSLPRGIMAYATRTTVGLTTSIADIGLSVTFTAEENRLYKYTFYCYASNSTVSGTLGTFVTDSSNNVKEALNLYVVGGGNYTFQHLTYISTETAGTVTRKIRANTQFGVGTLYAPLYFFVEDIGLA
jgi:hypothetical protein